MQDMTISEIIDDPMIHVMLSADRISHNAFAQFLESAARVHARRKENGREHQSHKVVSPGRF